jgi:hypothetical protein
MEGLCLTAEPSSRASNPPSLKGYSGGLKNLEPLKADSTGNHLKVAFARGARPKHPGNVKLCDSPCDSPPAEPGGLPQGNYCARRDSTMFIREA